MISPEGMTFGAAVELSVAMPLSWLPLISDYTREAAKPVKATAVSAIVYGIVSCWMYTIGMGAAIFTGEGNIASIMVKAGLGIAGLLIIIFSTVTTTFLDAYSAGVSSESIIKGISPKQVGIVVTVVGTVAAIAFPMDDITDFLYLIGSVFAPMIAIQIADFFLLKKDESSKCAESGYMGDRISGLQRADACRYARGQYAAGYADHDCNLLCSQKGCTIGKKHL